MFNANIFDFAGSFYLNRSFGMGMTLYSCVTPSVQMSQKRYYLHAKAGGCEGRTQGGLRGLEHSLDGNRLNTNLLLTFVKTQNNSAHAYIAI